MYADAQIYAARYTAEAARLSGIESRSRWQGASVDDEAVKRISSFQQSYNEMIKGEQFVMKETRSRARQRLRLPVALGAAALLLGLLGWMAGLQKILKIPGSAGGVEKPHHHRICAHRLAPGACRACAKCANSRSAALPAWLYRAALRAQIGTAGCVIQR